MTLQEVYDQAKLKLPQELHSRLDRAVGILNGDDGYNVTQLDKGDTWLVQHNRDGIEQAYIVDHKEKMCTCPDYAKALRGYCKHRLAIMLHNILLYKDTNNIQYRIRRDKDMTTSEQVKDCKLDIKSLIFTMTELHLTSVRTRVVVNGKTYVVAIWEKE